jgi:hypothetical protein
LSRTMKWLGAAVVVAVVAAGLFLALRPRHGSLVVASPAAGGSGSKTAGLSGRLDGVENPDRSACFWVQGSAGKVYLQWPAGWSAERIPLRVLDEHGVVQATKGDVVTLGGGSISEAIAHCPAGRTIHFSVGTVSTKRS